MAESSEDQDDVLQSPKDQDDVFQLGRYQYTVIFLLGLPTMFHSMQLMNVVFILAEPDHRCELPVWTSGDTYVVQGERHRASINATIPSRLGDNGEADPYSTCTYFVYENMSSTDDGVLRNMSLPYNGNTTSSYLRNATIGSIPGNTATVRREERCLSWVYDKETYGSTVVSDMDLVCDRSIWKANAAMIHMLGYSVGSTFGGVLSDSIGRKKVYFLSLVPMLVGGVGQALAPNFTWFMLLRMLTGIGNGVIFVVYFVLSMELIDTSHRGIVGIGLEQFWVVGITAYGGLAYAIRDWRHLQLLISVPFVAGFALWWFIPESPRWLLTKGRVKEAEEVMKKISTTNKIQWSPTSLKLQNNTQNGETGKLWHLFTDRTLFFRAIVVFINWIFVSMLFYGLAMNLQNLGGNLYINYLLSCVSEAFAYTLSMWAIRKCGRKVFHCSVMLLGGGGCIATVFPMALGGSDFHWMTIVFAMLGKFGVAAAFACIYIYTSELFPTAIRSATIGTSSVLARVGSIVAPYIAQLGTMVGERSGSVLPMLVFGLSAILAGLLALTLPETRTAQLPDTVSEARNIGRGKEATPGEKTKDDDVELDLLNKA